ncbi:MAG TPA: ice-binding family protein [Verrucomicrobiae bacterium]|nr:ice-binding family protein [Verrucomicrobiae bacterium]
MNGTTHLGDSLAAQAQLDLTTAYNDAAGRTVGAITMAGNLGGQTLTRASTNPPPRWRSVPKR